MYICKYTLKHTDMKKLKLLITGLLFASLVAVMVVRVNLKHSATKGQDIALSNMEALAQGESEEGDCMGSGNLVCGSGSYKVRVSR